MNIIVSIFSIVFLVLLADISAERGVS